MQGKTVVHPSQITDKLMAAMPKSEQVGHVRAYRCRGLHRTLPV